ncbi:MAG: transposase, partial [Chloroflexota bacterium]|nr:transposase [Chloroflexota bacterium]
MQAVIPAGESRRVVLWACDHSRFGLRTIRRRRITHCGVKPVGQCQYGYANFWLYGAVAPETGDGFFYVLPTLNAEHMQLFLNELAAARPDTLNVLLDNSRAHTAQELVLPSNIVLVFQPPYAPEVNPSERVWEIRYCLSRPQNMKRSSGAGLHCARPSACVTGMDAVRKRDST